MKLSKYLDFTMNAPRVNPNGVGDFTTVVCSLGVVLAACAIAYSLIPARFIGNPLPPIQLRRGEVRVSQTSSIKGRYLNHVYGYSVQIPNGLRAETESPPLPQHGFAIASSSDSERTIWVDGSYDVLDWKSLNEAADSDVKWLEEKATRIISQERKPVELDSLPALLTMVHFIDKTNKQAMVHQALIAFRTGRSPGQIEIVYEISMLTPEQHYPADQGVFEQLWKSWKLEDIPD